jgi:hypothetical protein
MKFFDPLLHGRDGVSAVAVLEDEALDGRALLLAEAEAKPAAAPGARRILVAGGAVADLEALGVGVDDGDHGRFGSHSSSANQV